MANPSNLSDVQVLQAFKDFNHQVQAIANTGANPYVVMAGIISATPSKLAHIYDKHAEDFGLSGPKNKDQLNSFQQAIENHVADPDTKLVSGQYRGQDANIYVNSRTNNAVVTDREGTVIAGFKLNTQQMNYVNTTGRLN